MIAKPSLARLPPARSSLVRLSFMLRTVWSKTCRPSASCGRHAELLAPPAGSTKSTRAGDISSAICGSVSWPKKTSERRVRERASSARMPGGRRIPWFSPVRVRRVVNAPERSGRIVSSVVERPAGSARAMGALSSEISAPRTTARVDMARSCHRATAGSRYPPQAMNRRPRLELHGSSATPEEAAAVIAAIEQFLRDTAPPPAPADATPSPWARAALREGVERAPAREAW